MTEGPPTEFGHASDGAIGLHSDEMPRGDGLCDIVNRTTRYEGWKRGR